MLKDRRAALPPAVRRNASARITEHLLALLDGTSPVMVYASKEPEVSTCDLIDALIHRGTSVVVPIIERETCSLRLSYLTEPAVLVESTFHVPEPVGNEIPARATDLAAVVVPMVGFDRSGNRLGYGAGYYDRFLAGIHAVRVIGLAFSCQEVPCIPACADDIGVDIVVTEHGVVRPS